MRVATAVGIAIGLIGAGVAATLALLFLGRDDGAVNREIDALRGELATARRASGELADRLDTLERTQRQIEAAQVVRTQSGAPHLPVTNGPEASPSGTTTPAAAFDPHRLLAEYVASFADGGQGSDFFRMAVAAYAWQLRHDLQAIAVDRDQPDALRLQVIAMLDGGSFRGDPGTIDALLEVARQNGWEEGATAALAGLAKIGDKRTAVLVEELAGSLRSLRLRKAAWEALVTLLGADADVALLRLLEREPDLEGRIALLGYFRGGNHAAALRAFELASRDEQPLRLEAAGRIGRFRDEEFVALTQDWLAREQDEPVRARLQAALEQQRQVPAWHELQACGAPDVEHPGSDDRRAWASAQPDAGKEWLELSYVPRRADRVTIHESCVPGAVIAVEVLEAKGAWRTVWSGSDPTTQAGPFVVEFPTTANVVSKVRITLDTAKQSGWSEIDAVELSGPDGRGWATGASASSRYGEGGGVNSNTVEGLDLYRALQRQR
jgi:hypothetical protein